MAWADEMRAGEPAASGDGRRNQAVALRLMAEGGPDAISLRAIAREMGMTAGAIYGYYADP